MNQVEQSKIPNQNQPIFEPIEFSDVGFEAKSTQLNQQLSPQHSTVYRPDIDGLRTIAIVLVVVYHAFPKYLPGGFIGVDIFFVISGYLISQIVIKQTDKGNFSYLNFYVRRIKRIFPSLLLILLFTLYLAAKYSEKDQLKLTLGTLNASVVFGANIQILNYKKGYFDADLRVNPLLHLWSLGVEEQFYIVWPCLLALVLKFCRKWTFLILSLFAVISFFISIESIYSNPKFAFYFPVCRFWQMAIGGILVYVNLDIKSFKINNILSTSAIIAISSTVLILNDQSMFPGFWALIPTFSSAFIIQAKEGAFINKYILSSWPFVFIGKMSYSLYLWHWPFLILCHTYYPYGSKSLWANNFFILFVVLLFTIITFVFVQNPVRYIKSKKVVIVLIMLMVGVLFASFWVQQNVLTKMDLNQHETVKYSKKNQEQMKPRYPQDYFFKNDKKHANPSISRNRLRPTLDKLQIHSRQEQYDYGVKGKEYLLDKDIDKTSMFDMKTDTSFLRHYEVSNEGQQNLVFLIGDSHTSKISHRFQQLYKQSLIKFTPFPTIVSWVRFGMFDIDNSDIYPKVLALKFVQKYRPQRILITRHWLLAWCKDLDQPFEQQHKCDMKKLDEQLSMIVGFIKECQRMGSQVSITDVAIQYWSLHPNKMKDGNGDLIEQNLKPFKLSDFRNKFKNVIEKFHQAIRPLNVELITLTDNHCWENVCQRFTPSGHPIHADQNHYGKIFVRHWMTSVDYLVQF